MTDLRVVLPDQTIERGSIEIQGATITVIREGSAPSSDLDGRGLIAIPGLIDLHGDMLERDLEPRPGVFFPVELALYELDKRLAGAGVTTAYAAISFLDRDSGALTAVRTSDRARQIVETVVRLRGRLATDFRVHARYEVTNPGAAPIVSGLIEEGKVDLVSLMDHTPGQGQYRDLKKYAEIIEQWRRVSQAEAEDMLRARQRRAEEQPTSWTAAREVAAVARRHGLPVASHDDDTPQKVAAMAGFGVTISEFPVTIEAAMEARARGLRVAMGAPNLFLGGSHTGNLSAGDALRAGVVDLLVADYYPAALLQSVFALARDGRLPLHEAVGLVTEAPGRALGLEDRGRLAVGLAADLALVEEGSVPRVRGTIRGGAPVYWDTTMTERCRPTIWAEGALESARR